MTRTNDGDVAGMTLRQYYAGLALQAIIPTQSSGQEGIRIGAHLALSWADALIEVLAQHEELYEPPSS